eukprot:CAMPEP_0176010628 /NCGR_PEP_ID=MMETSP0120_2-20121206/4867_1 /TAXON_ID=160619 /ORGANISM="Kryptoperidinium foliaceum, Strain CCMP 1326" /LENGTH=773 /DNA_ID=CAMNT_0017343467 /DNA_START=9 /DNA_END=2327 /DNA_ORIENTATION=-
MLPGGGGRDVPMPGGAPVPAWMQQGQQPNGGGAGPIGFAGHRSPGMQPALAAPSLTTPRLRSNSFIGMGGCLSGPLAPPGHQQYQIQQQVGMSGRFDGQPVQQVGQTRVVSAVRPNADPRSYEDAEISHEARNIWVRIAGDEGETMSRLQLIRALMEDRTVAAFVLPGIDGSNLMENDDAYEAAHHLFNDISRGKQRVRFQDFLKNFQSSKASVSKASELRAIFERLDCNKDNRISRHELLSAVKRDRVLFDLFLRGVEAADDMDDEALSGAVDDIYKAIAGDWKHFDFADFIAYFRTISRVEGCGLHQPIDRRSRRVLIIGPGFGTQLNPMQTQVVMQSGFQIFWVHNVPNPEETEFRMLPHVSKIRDSIDQIRPDLVMCGSKGGAYGVALWQMGYWRGPTLLINAHPSCTELPYDVPIIMTHGDQDPVYPRPREELETLINTGSRNMCFLYYSSTSGTLASGHTPRVGDQHNMASLIHFETLPRLMESVLCPEGPELHFMRTWTERLTQQRQEAENRLGYTPQKLRQFWVSTQTRAAQDSNDFLQDVPRGSQEFHWVSTVFRHGAKDVSTYGYSKEKWERCGLIRIQRIENASQDEGGTAPYYNSLRHSFECMGIEFIPGVHTRWLFHGSSAIDSIVSNPIQGFQPLASGTAGEAAGRTSPAMPARRFRAVLRRAGARRHEKDADVLGDHRHVLRRQPTPQRHPSGPATAPPVQLVRGFAFEPRDLRGPAPGRGIPGVHDHLRQLSVAGCGLGVRKSVGSRLPRPLHVGDA